MHHIKLCPLFMIFLAHVVLSSDTELSKKPDNSAIDHISPLAFVGQTDPDDLEKRNWNNLSGMWGKRGWNNLNGAWGKRNNNWNNLSGMWGKRDWNDLSGMWGKRGWNHLSGMWGKRGNWNNLSNMWGKRGWNNLSGAWGKRGWNNLNGAWGKRIPEDNSNPDDNNKRTTQWNNLKGVWGKRGDADYALAALWERMAEDYNDAREPLLVDSI